MSEPTRTTFELVVDHYGTTDEVIARISECLRSHPRASLRYESLRVADPTDTERDRLRARAALRELLTLRWLYGTAGMWRAAVHIHKAIEALGGKALAEMPPGDAFTLISAGDNTDTDTGEE